MSKIALVTGGSRGLGKDMALQLAQKGNDVILTYVNNKELADAVVAEIEALGQKATALHLDMGNTGGLTVFVDDVQKSLAEKFKTAKFDFLINNAGMGGSIPFLEATEDDFDRFMNVHFKSVFFLTQKLVPVLNDGGAIINISTGTTRFANPGYSIYASMKGAIEVFTRYIAKELGARRIRVNVVAPGPVETDFNNATIRNNPQLKTMLGNNTALGRVGEATDIGGVVATMCSDEMYWVNGQRIEASGGINL